MSSDLFEYLMKDREAELREQYETQLQQELQEKEAQVRQELHQKEEQLQQKEEQLRQQLRQQLLQERQQLLQELHQILEETLLVRFPDAPLALVRLLRRIQQPADVRHLIIAVQQVPDLATAEHLLNEAAQRASVQ